MVKMEFLLSRRIHHELAGAITKLLLDDELRERLGLSGYEFVHEECNCISMAKNSLRLYEQVLKNNDNK